MVGENQWFLREVALRNRWAEQTSVGPSVYMLVTRVHQDASYAIWKRLQKGWYRVSI